MLLVLGIERAFHTSASFDRTYLGSPAGTPTCDEKSSALVLRPTSLSTLRVSARTTQLTRCAAFSYTKSAAIGVAAYAEPRWTQRLRFQRPGAKRTSQERPRRFRFAVTRGPKRSWQPLAGFVGAFIIADLRTESPRTHALAGLRRQRYPTSPRHPVHRRHHPPGTDPLRDDPQGRVLKRWINELCSGVSFRESHHCPEVKRERRSDPRVN